MKQLVGALLRLQAIFMGSDYLHQDSQTHSHAIDLSTQWKVLGPFQIGTRGIHCSCV